MKKNNIYVLALTALLGLGTITTVASCGGPSMGSTEATGIKFSRDAVTEIEVGETIDLAKFVTVAPEDAKWRVEAKTSNIKVKGTKITGTAPGAFKVTIFAGVTELPKNYSGVVISHNLAKLKKAMTEVEKGNYTAVLADGEELLSIAWHDQDYFGFLTFDDTNTPFLSGLFNTAAGHVAEYAITGAWEIDDNFLPVDGTFNVLPGLNPSLDLFVLGGGFELTGEEFADDEDTPELIMDVDYFDKLAPIWCGVDSESIENGLKTTISALYASYDETANEVKIAIASKTKDICTLTLTNIGTTKLAPVEKFIADKKEPEQLAFEGFNSLMTEAIEKKNYSLNGTVEIGYYDKTNVWHATDNKTVLADVYENWGEMEPASYECKVDDETYYSKDLATNAISGYTKKDDTFYYVDGTISDEEAGTYTWEAEASTSDVLTSIWVNNLSMNQQGYTSHAAFAIGDYTEEMLASINWSSVTADKSGNIVATATPYGDEGHALALGMALIPQIGNGYAWMMSTLSSSAYPSAHWYDFFDTQEYVYNPTEKTITINTTLDGLSAVGNQYYGVRFIVEIGNVGTTTLPEFFPSAAFVA